MEVGRRRSHLPSAPRADTGINLDTFIVAANTVEVVARRQVPVSPLPEPGSEHLGGQEQGRRSCHGVPGRPVAKANGRVSI